MWRWRRRTRCRGRSSSECIPTVGPFILPKIMPRLHEAAPRLRIYLREEQTAALIGRLEAGRLDAVILALPAPLTNVDTEDLALDRFHLVCPRRHRLASMPAVRAADLASEDLLLLEDGHCLTGHALAACALEGARRNVAFQGTSLMTLVQMVAIGLGVTLAPEMAIEAGLFAASISMPRRSKARRRFAASLSLGARRPAGKRPSCASPNCSAPAWRRRRRRRSRRLPICRRVKVALESRRQSGANRGNCWRSPRPLHRACARPPPPPPCGEGGYQSPTGARVPHPQRGGGDRCDPRAQTLARTRGWWRGASANR